MSLEDREYVPTIGLEVHAELKTDSKLFCGCKNDPHDSKPNSHICPICMGHPGTLPVVNLSAIQHLITFGVAVGGTIATYTEFDRKHYFYPDIPKGYQISQYAYPIVTGGSLNGVLLTRVHLEEDTARSQHEGENSLIDYNRSGVPLMELVTEPVIHSAKEAVDFARELQLLLQFLGIASAHMERGELRIEANISVSRSADFGTKVEVKNLNSFKSVLTAINFEIERQIALLKKGEEVAQETRGFKEETGKTFSQRKKETSKDYRYFPDPDVVPANISILHFDKSREAEILQKTPLYIRKKFEELGLTRNHIEAILPSQELRWLFMESVEVFLSKRYDTDMTQFPSLMANYIASDVAGLRTTGSIPADSLLKPVQFVRLMELVSSKTITSRIAKDILAEVVMGADPYAVIETRGISIQDGDEALSALVSLVIAENPSVAREYVAGKENALQFLIGQCMKKTKGAARPEELSSLLKEVLKKNTHNLPSN